MGYTNKTSHYELPQYVANDKPSWLGDFNAAMLKIDTVMADNDATAEAANSAATGAQTQVAALSAQLSTIQGQVNTAVDTATTADGKATTAQTVAGQANTTAGEAKTLAQAAKQTADNALPISGGTMTGPLVLAGAPTADNQAATKAYVDGHSSAINSGSIPFSYYAANMAGGGTGELRYYGKVFSMNKCNGTYKGVTTVGVSNFMPFAYVAGNPLDLPVNRLVGEIPISYKENASGTAGFSAANMLYDGTNTYVGIKYAGVGNVVECVGCGIAIGMI